MFVQPILAFVLIIFLNFGRPCLFVLSFTIIFLFSVSILPGPWEMRSISITCLVQLQDKIWFQNQFDSDGDILRCSELKIEKMRPFMVPFHLFPISSTSYNLLWWSDGKESVRRHWWKTNTPGQKAPCGLGGRVIFSALDEPCIKFR